MRDMLNLTLLARTVAAQEGTAPKPGNPPPYWSEQDPFVNAAALLRLKAKLKEWSDGTEPIPPAILPTYEGQTWVDSDTLNYGFDRPAPHPNPNFHQMDRWEMESTLTRLLEEIHPTKETIHGARRYICYDRSDLNIRVAPDYYFAKGVPGPGILATKLYLPWAVGKAPDFVLKMASPDKAAEDLTVKRKLYQEIGVAEYWRLDPTGGELYGSPVAGDRLEGGVCQAIPMHRMREGIMGGHSQAAGIDVFWVDDGFVYLDPSKDE